MDSLSLGSLQRSIVEDYLIEGGRCEDEPALDLDAIQTHLIATGRLLVTPASADTLWRELMDLVNGFDDDGEQKCRDSIAALASRVYALRATQTQA